MSETPATRSPSTNRSMKPDIVAEEKLLPRGLGAVVRLALQQFDGHCFGLRPVAQMAERSRKRRKSLIGDIGLACCPAGELCRDVILAKGEMRPRTDMVETGNVAVARTEHGRPVEQRFCFDLSPVPEQVEPLREIGLRKAWIELQGYIERRQRFVILMGHAQHSSERAVTETIEFIERHRMTPLAQRLFQSRRAIFRLVNEGALQIDVAESAMAAARNSDLRRSHAENRLRPSRTPAC